MGTKQKIGTALDSKVIRLLRQRSRNTGKPVNRIIEEAVLAHGKGSVSDGASSALRLEAMRGFFSGGPSLPPRVVEEILAEDPFDQ